MSQRSQRCQRHGYSIYRARRELNLLFFRRLVVVEVRAKGEPPYGDDGRQRAEHANARLYSSTFALLRHVTIVPSKMPGPLAPGIRATAWYWLVLLRGFDGDLEDDLVADDDAAIFERTFEVDAKVTAVNLGTCFKSHNGHAGEH